MAEINSFGVQPITCHSFSRTGSKLALSHNNNEVKIYQKEGTQWIQNSVLSQHDLRINSIDWAPKSNRIVTCSADRNAYVWTFVDNKWKPTLVILRINRAATCVRWSPKEDKFAMGSAAKLLSICYFNEANEWWVSKQIKKPIKSTVTCLDWHPNNVLLGCGSTDFKARVYSTYIKEVDGPDNEPTSWVGKMNFGSLIAEFSSGSGAWVHAISFSADGNKLAWVSQNSSISVVDATKGMTAITIKTRYLPYLTCVWSSHNTIVAAGHDCCPMLFKYDETNGKVVFVDKLDKSQKKEADGFSAMRKFRDMDKRAIRDIENNTGGSGDCLTDTIHQNTILEVRLVSGTKSDANKISTVSLDGKMVLWDLSQSKKLIESY